MIIKTLFMRMSIQNLLKNIEDCKPREGSVNIFDIHWIHILDLSGILMLKIGQIPNTKHNSPVFEWTEPAQLWLVFEWLTIQIPDTNMSGIQIFNILIINVFFVCLCRSFLPSLCLHSNE